MICYTFLLASLSAIACAQSALQTVFQFPSPPASRYINIENIAPRQNGQFLLTIATGPSLYQFNPASPSPELVTMIPGPVDSLTGIAETYPGSDVWVVAAGNFTFGPQVPGGLAGIPGTWQIWSIDLSGSQPVTKQIAAIPDAIALDGAASVPGLKDTVMFADGGLGAVWSVNVKSGEYKIAIQDPLFNPTANFSLGINGLKASDRTLYFTNSAQRLYGKVSLDCSRYAKVGATSEIQVIASTPPPAGVYAYDDFALDSKNNAYIATPPNAITAVTPEGSVQIIAGGGDDMTLAGPTSAALDKSGCTLYITTGGVGGPPGQEQSGGVYSLSICNNNNNNNYNNYNNNYNYNHDKEAAPSGWQQWRA